MNRSQSNPIYIIGLPKLMNYKVLLILWLTLCCVLPIEGVVLPTFLWDTINPLFNETKCGKTSELQVNVNDLLNFLCPSRAMNNVVMTDIRNYDDMYENLWLTDNQDVARNCDTSGASHLFDCNKPNELMYYGCNFRPRMSHANFRPGKRYFFFGTGDGSKTGLKNKIGGHCRTHNMMLSVYVCQSHEICNKTMAYSCYKENKVEVKYMSGPKIAPRKGQNLMADMGDGLVSLCFLALFFIGFAVGVVVKMAFEKIQRKYCKPGPSSFRLASPAKSTYSDPEANGNCTIDSRHCVLENECDANQRLSL